MLMLKASYYNVKHLIVKTFGRNHFLKTRFLIFEYEMRINFFFKKIFYT